MFSFSFIAAAATLAQAGLGLPKEYVPVAPPPDKVVATVNGVPLKASDVAPMLWQIYKDGIEQDLIDYLMVKSAADKAKVSVSDDEVRAQLATALDQYKATLPPGVTIQEGLRTKGFSDSRLVLRIKTQLLLDKMIMADFHPEGWVKVSTLIFETPGGDPVVTKAAGAKALDYYAKLEKGVSWDSLLGQLTSKQQVLSNGGSIGWHSLSDFPKNVKDQLVSLKPGQYMHPEQTTIGIQIFRLDKAGADAAGPDLSDLKKAFLQSKYGETTRRLRAETKIVRTDSP